MSTTWASTGARSAKATCTTGNESAPAAPVKASQTVAFSAAEAGNTVTVRGMTFTAIANGETPANTQEFAVGTGGTADTDTGAAFAAAVNANRSILGLTAANATGTVTLTANDYGTGPNAWTLTKVGTPVTVGGATFASGVALVGVNVSGMGAVQLFLEAASGQTVVNGNIAAFVFNANSGLWSRVPSLDVAVATATTRGSGGSFQVNARQGYYAWIPVGVTVSSGSVVCWNNVYTPDGVLV